jgi:hypothetical protein
MTTGAGVATRAGPHPARVRVAPALEARDRLTTAFRILLAIPHLLLVGGPMAAALSWSWATDPSRRIGGGAGGGVMGAVAFVAAVISWFAIVATGRQPQGLWDLTAFYLRWRVRAVAYTAMLRDEYPPFGDGPYPAELELRPPDAPRPRLTVAFRVILALPHLLAVWFLGIAWAFTSLVAWLAILLNGSYPRALYEFATGVLRWNTRVEAYLLLLCDAYPPFSLADGGET